MRKPPADPVLWSQDELDELKRLRASGMLMREIAAKLGRTTNSVIGCSRRIGVPVKLLQRDWADADLVRLRELRGQGMSASRIAVVMGRKKGAVLFRMAALGLSTERLSRRPRKSRALAPEMRKPRPPRVVVAAPRPVAEPPVKRTAPAPVQAVDGRGCQFPLWGNADRAPYPPLFCGAPVSAGSWCDECRRVVFAPPRPANMFIGGSAHG